MSYKVAREGKGVQRSCSSEHWRRSEESESCWSIEKGPGRSAWIEGEEEERGWNTGEKQAAFSSHAASIQQLLPGEKKGRDVNHESTCIQVWTHNFQRSYSVSVFFFFVFHSFLLFFPEVAFTGASVFQGIWLILYTGFCNTPFEHPEAGVLKDPPSNPFPLSPITISDTCSLQR